MQTRRFRRAGHNSTLAIFGAAAFWQGALQRKSVASVIQHHQIGA